jgi:CrcB protein
MDFSWQVLYRRGGRLSRYLLIAIGGALGAMARYQLTVMILSRIFAGFPWATFAVNVSGCVAMGVASALLTEPFALHPNWRYLVPIGFIGAYTTFSAFEADTFVAITSGAWATGASYVVGSVVAGYAALWIGLWLGRMF